MPLGQPGDGNIGFPDHKIQWLAAQLSRHYGHLALNGKTLRPISINARRGAFASFGRALRRPFGLARPSSIVISKPPVAVQSTAAGCLNYPYRTPDLADIHFLNAKKIVLMQDNLNIHIKASLYEAFPAAEARRLAERFEWHYTPKHGSWLDMAESELGVLSSQCLDRRIPDKQTPRRRNRRVGG